MRVLYRHTTPSPLSCGMQSGVDGLSLEGGGGAAGTDGVCAAGGGGGTGVPTGAGSGADDTGAGCCCTALRLSLIHI